MRPDNRGFSLIELIVVVGIVSILLALVGLSGKRWFDQYTIESLVKTLHTDLTHARVSAMQKNRAYFFTLSSSQYMVYADRDPLNSDLDGDGALQTATDTLIIQKSLSANYGLTTDPTITTMTFNTRGLVDGLSGTIEINAPSSYQANFDCVEISVTRIRVGAHNGTDCVEN